MRSVVVLPAPFGPEEGDDLALGHVEVDAVDGGHLGLLAPGLRDWKVWVSPLAVIMVLLGQS